MQHDCGRLQHDQLDRAVNPVGTVIFKASLRVPEGYLLCDGSAVSRTKYAALFADIGTVFGSGDGTTTFALPDVRKRVAVGYDSTDTDFDSVGHTGGSKAAVLLAHTHTFTDAASRTQLHDNDTTAWGNLAWNATASVNTSSEGVADAGNQNLQPYIVFPAFIKY
jgi:microcystin-dependent protein